MRKLACCYLLSVSFLFFAIHCLQLRSFVPRKEDGSDEIISVYKDGVPKPTEPFVSKSFPSPKFRHVILVAQPRTGSTVIAKTLVADNDAIFYSMEPLNLAMRTETVRVIDTAAHVNFLKRILLCKFNEHEKYQQLRRKRLWHLTTQLVRDLCYPDSSTSSQFNTICDLDQEFRTDETICNHSQLHLVKTIYLRLKTAAILLSDPDLDLALIYLVRDPRGTLSSRQTLNDSTFFFSSVFKDERALCAQIREDAPYLHYIQKTSPHRLLQMRYEDFGMNPVLETRKLYSFLGLPFTASTEAFLSERTMQSASQRDSKFSSSASSMNDDDDAFSTNRHSQSTVFKWTKLWTFQNVSRIQNSCWDVLAAFGYNVFNTEEKYNNSITPLKKSRW